MCDSLGRRLSRLRLLHDEQPLVSLFQLVKCLDVSATPARDLWRDGAVPTVTVNSKRAVRADALALCAEVVLSSSSCRNLLVECGNTLEDFVARMRGSVEVFRADARSVLLRSGTTPELSTLALSLGLLQTDPVWVLERAREERHLPELLAWCLRRGRISSSHVTETLRSLHSSDVVVSSA